MSFSVFSVSIKNLPNLLSTLMLNSLPYIPDALRAILGVVHVRYLPALLWGKECVKP